MFYPSFTRVDPGYNTSRTERKLVQIPDKLAKKYIYTLSKDTPTLATSLPACACRFNPGVSTLLLIPSTIKHQGGLSAPE